MNFTMHTVNQVLLGFTLFLCGIYAGLALMCQIGILPMMRQLNLKAYAEAWRIIDGYMERSMPPYKAVLLAVNLAACLCLGFERQVPLTVVCAVSFLLSIAALVLTIAKQIPLNKKLRLLPADADERVLLEIREQTVRNFAVRMVMALLSFALLCVGAVMFPVG